MRSTPYAPVQRDGQDWISADTIATALRGSQHDYTAQQIGRLLTALANAGRCRISHAPRYMAEYQPIH